MTYFNFFTDTDLITSFSNPNYLLGMANQNMMQVAKNSATRSNDNNNLADNCPVRSDILAADIDELSSGDSAISSPTGTESDLASPDVELNQANCQSRSGERYGGCRSYDNLRSAVQAHLLNSLGQPTQVVGDQYKTNNVEHSSA